MKFLTRALVLILGILLSSTAFALDMDFYTYGGFAETVNIFTRLSIIFNDNEYLYLFAVTCVFGIIFGGIMFYGKQLLGGFQGGGFSLAWLFTVILGVAIFKGLIIPKGTVHIYDPVKNNYQAVGNIPDLIILMAGSMNKFERIIVEVVDASSAHPYKQDAGGVSFELLYNASSTLTGFGDAYMNQSLKRYYKDCSLLPLSDNTSTFNLNTLFYTTTNIMTELEKLRSPADYTVYTTASNKKGLTLTCEQAWDNFLKPYLLLGTNYDDQLLSVCKKSGFNVNSVAEITRCKESLTRINTTVFDVTNNHIHLLRSVAITKSITDAILDENPDIGLKALTNKAIMMDGLGTSSSAEDWLPTMKSVITTIVLALTPLLICLIVTPLVWKSIFLMLGLYIWLTLWGCVDVIMHGILMDQAINVMADIQEQKMGIGSMITAPSAALKALAIFGKARSMGVTIATVIAASVFGFSGYAMAGMASNMQGTIDKEGTDAANKSNSPEGHANQLESLKKGFATEYNNANAGFEGTANSEAYDQSANQVRAETVMNNSGLGLGAATQSGRMRGGAESGSMMQTINSANARGQSVAEFSQDITSLESQKRFGGIKGEEAAHAANGESVQDGTFGNSYFSKSEEIAHKESIAAFHERFDLENGKETSDNEFFGMMADIQTAHLKGQMNAVGENPDSLVDFYKTNTSLDTSSAQAMVNTAAYFGMSIEELGSNEGIMRGIQGGSNQDVLSTMKPEEIAAGSTAAALRSGTEGTAWLNRAEGYEGGAKQMFQDIGDYKTSNEFAGFLAFSNTAEQMNKTNDEMALAMNSSGISFAFNADDVPTMLDNGMINDPKVADNLIAQGGGTMTSSFDPKTGHSVTATSRTGQSFVLDSSYQDIDSERYDSSITKDNRKVTETGTQIGATSAADLLLNENRESELEQFLRDTDGDIAGRENLIQGVSSWVSNIGSSTVSENYINHRDATIYASAEAGVEGKLFGAVAKASVGGKTSTGWSGNDVESDNWNATTASVREIINDSEDRAITDANIEVNKEARTRYESSHEIMTVEDRDQLRDDLKFDYMASYVNDGITQLYENRVEESADFTENSELSEQVREKIEEAENDTGSNDVDRRDMAFR